MIAATISRIRNLWSTINGGAAVIATLARSRQLQSAIAGTTGVTATITKSGAGPVSGDILAVAIRPDGWSAEVTVKGLATGGTYDIGLGTDYDYRPPHQPKFVLQVSSPGYDSAASATTVSRTVYATLALRKPYPNDGQKDESASGSDVIIRLVLSEFVGSADTITALVFAGLYTQGGTASRGATISATNGSTQGYGKVIGNWAWPDMEPVANTLTPRFVAFHRSGRDGKPVACVKFTAQDQSGHSATQVITAPTCETGFGDAQKVTEYVGSIDISSFTAGDIVTCNAVAYPLVGASSDILDTGDGAYTWPTAKYRPAKWRKLGGAFVRKVAVVDSTNGNNATGAVIDFSSFNSGSPPASFLNIYAAMNAIRVALGNQDDIGGHLIYLRGNSGHAWAGGAYTSTIVMSNLVLEIASFPGETATINSNASTNRGKSGFRVKFSGLINASTSSSDSVTGNDVLWYHGCTLSTAASNPWYAPKYIWLTQSTVSRCGNTPFSTVNATPTLVRGNTFNTSASGAISCCTLIGNAISSSVAPRFWYSGQTCEEPDGMIFAFNRDLTSSTSWSSALFQTAGSGNIGRGLAIVQNLVESLSATSPLLQIAADQSTTDEINNVLIWQNTFVGQRQNLAYNDYNLNGIGPKHRRLWSLKGNIFSQCNHITDTDSHGGTPDGLRTGGWPVFFGVGKEGCIDLNPPAIGDLSGSLEYPGLMGKQGANSVGIVGQFVSDKSYVGAGGGGGDYHLQAGSPARDMIAGAPIPYDLEGNARNLTLDAAGVYKQ